MSVSKCSPLPLPSMHFSQRLPVHGVPVGILQRTSFTTHLVVSQVRACLLSYISLLLAPLVAVHLCASSHHCLTQHTTHGGNPPVIKGAWGLAHYSTSHPPATSVCGAPYANLT